VLWEVGAMGIKRQQSAKEPLNKQHQNLNRKKRSSSLELDFARDFAGFYGFKWWAV